jgi:hypothetical protein
MLLISITWCNMKPAPIHVELHFESIIEIWFSINNYRNISSTTVSSAVSWQMNPCLSYPFSAACVFDQSIQFWHVTILTSYPETLSKRTSTFNSPIASENLTILLTRGSLVPRNEISWKTLNASTPTNVLYTNQNIFFKIRRQYISIKINLWIRFMKLILPVLVKQYQDE